MLGNNTDQMNTSPDSTPAAAESQSLPAAITTDAPCLGCGYNLLGIARSGRCPECGSSVARSLRGNLLEYASVEYLRTLRAGGIVVIVGTFISFVGEGTLDATLKFLSTLTGSTSRGAPETLESLTNLLASVLWVIGWWMLTTPDPGLVGPDADMKPRRTLRWALIVSASLMLGKAVIEFLPSAGRSFNTANTGGILTISRWPSSGPDIAIAILFVLIGGASLAFIIVCFFVSLKLVNTLASRASDKSLEKFAAKCVWLLPTLIATLFAAPIAIILYLLLMFRLTFRIGAALQTARAAAAEAQL